MVLILLHVLVLAIGFLGAFVKMTLMTVLLPTTSIHAITDPVMIWSEVIHVSVRRSPVLLGQHAPALGTRVLMTHVLMDNVHHMVLSEGSVCVHQATQGKHVM